ncbi:MAG: hypothetical protein KME43_03680 [Myxacorys chilensis ATA2-1-KO14]|nr:hypothetical protein [Myxacorys chilensis ATA2-1-KO14]
MNHPSIQFGGLTLRSCIVPVLVQQTPLFAIQRPEVEGGPFRLSANFCNSNGNLILQIQDNEWQASSDSWDVEFSGGAITIRERRGQQCLRLKADPPYGLVVERLDMLLLGKRFIGSPTQLEVIAPNRKMTFTGTIADECVVGLALM